MSETHSTDDHAHGAHRGPAPPEEPKSPWWLPALGAALFVAVGLWWATSSSGDKAGAAGAASAGSARVVRAAALDTAPKPAAPPEGAPKR